MKNSRFNPQITLMSVAFLSTISVGTYFIHKNLLPIEQTVKADTVNSTTPSYTINGTVGPFTILKSATIVGTGTSTSGFYANAKENDSSAPTIVTGPGSVSVAGTYSGSSMSISSGANKGTYAANWGSASSLVTTGGYVVTGLNVGSSFNKTWSNIGTLNGKSLNVTMTFTVTALQNPSGTNNYIAVSNNLNTFVTSNNINGKFQAKYTYADGTPLSLSDMNQLAFLGGSLTPTTEYMTTSDASDVLLSSNSSVPTAVKGATNANASSLGLDSGLTTVFYSPSNSYTVSDTDFNSYGYAYGASFLNFSTATPTIYFGNWTASTGKISVQGANHLLFATETSPISVSKLLTASGASDYTLVTPIENAVLKNTISPSVLNDDSTATITKAVSSVVTGPDGKTYPASNVTVDTSGNVSIDKSIFTKAGNYTLTVTYTDSTGAIVTAYDNISVAVATNGMTAIATPVTVKNTNVPSGTPTINVTGPDGNKVDSSSVKLATQGSDGLVTLAGQNTPGIYTITLTYPSGLVIENYISVAQGDNTTVGINQTATVQNTVDKIISQNTTDHGNTITNPVLDLSSGVVGTITAPAGITVNPSDVTINSDGTVSLKGQNTAGVYTIPVTYTETYADGTGQKVTMTVTVNDVVTVVENQIPGFEISTVEGNSITGSNDLSTVDTGPLGLWGAYKSSINIISATAHDSAQTPITTGLNGKLITSSDFKVGQNLLEILSGGYTGDITASDNLPAGDYVIKATYIGQDGIQSSVNDIFHVYAKPMISSTDKTVMVGDNFTDGDTFTGGTDSMGNPINYYSAIKDGSLVVTDNVDLTSSGDYTITYTYTDPTTKAVTTTTSTLHVLDVPTITAPTISDTSVGLTVSTAGAKITDKNNLGNGQVTSLTVTAPDGSTISTDTDGNFDPKIAGNYKVIYSYDYTNPDGTKQTIKAITTVSVGDETFISSTPSNTIPTGLYNPIRDYMSSKNADGTDGNFTNTNNAKVVVVITDSTGNVMTPNADGTYLLNDGSYTETYSVTDSKGNVHSSTTLLTSQDLTAISSKTSDTLATPAPGLTQVTYNPIDDYINSVNADGSDGNFDNTNKAKVTVVITDGGDENGLGAGNIIKSNSDGTYVLTANHRYTEVYSVTNSNEQTVSSTTQIAVPNAVADSSILTSKSMDTLPAGSYKPQTDLTAVTNADGSNGLSSLTLNNSSIHAIIKDPSGKTVFDGDLSTDSSVNLPTGSYNVTFTGKDASGNTIVTTTTISVTDNTAISSKNTDKVSVGTYNPTNDYIASTNTDASKASLSNTNGNPVQITITDSSKNPITPSADGTYNLTGGDYTVTYTVKNSDGNSVNATTQLTVTDNTNLTSKDGNTTVGKSFIPSDNLTGTTNADGTDGTSDLTNGKIVTVEITDKNNQVIYSGPTNQPVPDGTLSGGDYTITYNVTDSNGKTVSSTSKLTVTDKTAISSKTTDNLALGSDYKPSTDFIGSTNADGTDGSIENTNNETVQVKITDKNGLIIWSGNADDTVSTTKLPQGQYNVTYSVLDSNKVAHSTTTKLNITASATISSKDSTINVGATWNGNDNFSAGFDSLGNPIAFSDVTVSGNVNTKKAGAYTVTYTFTDQNTGQKVTTSATVNVIDNTAISSKTSDSILVGNDFSPKTDYISSTNADKTSGSLTSTNSAKISLKITDSNGKTVWIGTADENVPASKLTTGNYNVTYQVTDTNGKIISSTTALKVINIDQTDLVSKTADSSPAGTYNPSTSYISSSNADGSSASLANTNGNSVQVTITDKTGKTIYQGPADHVLSLVGGTYTLLYSVENADGNKILSTTQLNVTDQTAISSKSTDKISSGNYNPNTDYISSKNADGTDGTLSSTNDKGVLITLSDKNGQIIPANADGTYSLKSGAYTEIYTVTDSNGHSVSSSTLLNSQDLTSINSKANVTTDAPKAGQLTVPFDPASAFDSATNTDGSAGKLTNTNGAKITVTVLGKNGQVIPQNPDYTYSLTPNENYTVTYTAKNASGTNVSTTTEVNVPNAIIDNTNLKSTTIVSTNVSTYNPVSDLTNVKNADGTDGSSSLLLNNNPIHVTIIDENGKMLLDNQLTTDSSIRLTGGTYTVTYTGKDLLGNIVTTTTIVNVSDQTSLVSNSVNNNLKANQIYQPATEIIKDKNADGTDGSTDKTNNQPVKIIITDENGKIIVANADGTYKLPAGSYLVTYQTTDSNGQNIITTTKVNIADFTSIVTKGTEQITGGEDFNPLINLTSITNADGTTASATNTNGKSVKVTITDKNGKVIYAGDIDAKIPAKKLPVGEYTVTYLVNNSNGNIVENTTTLTVQEKSIQTPPNTTDKTSLTSKKQDEIADGATYKPSDDLLSATDQVGNKLSSSDISVEITNSLGRIIWLDMTNKVIPSNILSPGDYQVTYKYHDKTSITLLKVLKKAPVSIQQSIDNNPENPTNPKTHIEKTEKKNNTNLPQTGEQANSVISLIGILITIEALLLRIFKKQQNNE